MKRDDALDLFYEYLGQPDDFETEYREFVEFLDDNPDAPEGEVKDFLDILIENLNEDDVEPQKKARKTKAIENALRVTRGAKAALSEQPATSVEQTPLQAFETLVADVRAYITTNATSIASDVNIEITLSKDDFSVSFERK